MADLTRFTTHTTSYKTLPSPTGPHKIAVSILVPKTLKPGPSPIFVKFHGGGLVQGTALYAEWIAGWLVPFIIRNNAVAVLPNYRLMPEHNGEEIMEDLRDFWEWFGRRGDDHERGGSGAGAADGTGGFGLQSYLRNKSWEISLDFSHICLDGDSAGGILAFNSVLLPHIKTLNERNGVHITAIIAHYPMTNILSREPQKCMPDGNPTPGEEIIDLFVQGVRPGTVISASTPWKRFPISYALAAYGRWLEFWSERTNPITNRISASQTLSSENPISQNATTAEQDKAFLPISLISTATSFPPTLILHGEQDTAVKIRDSELFVQKVRENERLGEQEKSYVRLVMKHGDHGFDIGLREEEMKWLRDEVGWIEGMWVGV